MNESIELQAAIINALRADATLLELVSGEIHESLPEHNPEPVVLLGPSDGGMDRADGLRYWEEALQIDVFAQTRGEKLPVKRIVSAIAHCLEYGEIQIAAPYAIEVIEIERVRVFPDKQSGEMRGVVQMNAQISKKV